ncbi:MAG: ABC transporter substrate-binding protein [Bradyrhizobium sp.]
MKRSNTFGLITGLLLGAMISTAPARAETEITIPGWADFSGPYADVMPAWSGGRAAVLLWWNKTSGAAAGVKLNYKGFDARYDPAQVASMWPGIRNDLKPIAMFGMGGADSAALQNRLPDDKVPMVSAVGGYGFTWAPNPWIFNLRPTLAHEAATFLSWYQKNKKMTRPVKIGVISSDAAPAWVDTVNGIKSYAKNNAAIVELVDVVWTTPQPTDLTTDVFALVNKNVDLIIVMTNTAGSVATKRALDSLSSKVPLLLGAHNGLSALAKAMGGLNLIEGCYESAAMAPPVENTPAFDFYKKLKAEYALKASWESATILGISQALYLTRILDETIKQSGADKLTGAKLREVMVNYTVPAKDMLGFGADIKMTDQSSFPLVGLRGYIATVQGGAITVLDPSAPVPDIIKW